MDRMEIVEDLWDIWGSTPAGSKTVAVPHDLVAGLIALLKEQEAVGPHYNARTNWYECGACKFSMTSGMHCKGELIPAYKVGFCAKCGQAVKWDA